MNSFGLSESRENREQDVRGSLSHTGPGAAAGGTRGA